MKKSFFILFSFKLFATSIKGIPRDSKPIRPRVWCHIRVHGVGWVGLPSFESFVFLIKLGEEFLAFCWDFIGLGLDHRVLLYRFGGLYDDLGFHVNLGVLVFHNNHSRLCRGLWDFDLRKSRLVSCLLYGIIGWVGSSVEPAWRRTMETADEVVYGAG